MRKLTLLSDTSILFAIVYTSNCKIYLSICRTLMLKEVIWLEHSRSQLLDLWAWNFLHNTVLYPDTNQEPYKICLCPVISVNRSCFPVFLQIFWSKSERPCSFELQKAGLAGKANIQFLRCLGPETCSVALPLCSGLILAKSLLPVGASVWSYSFYRIRFYLVLLEQRRGGAPIAVEVVQVEVSLCTGRALVLVLLKT